MGNSTIKKENCAISISVAQNQYTNSLSRLRDLDSKLNMMLALVAALIVGVGTVLTLARNSEVILLARVFAVITIITMLCALVLVLIGLFPRKYLAINGASLANDSVLSSDEIEVAKYYLEGYQGALSSILKLSELKNIFLKITSCFLMLSSCCFVTTVIILF